ncbi:2'-5' RNA ligase family protein [Acinetobacter sp. Marseille-Q1618]|uniref:2'-5' RNA ligase family protein n=1 Tax=Acinetobacter sp. Marseille-Q1618 TaxID=2697502 RepID=UPI0015700B70|nr:2'-5' RNA ligase family protein [Acinetobacter sp. Marseille-Q1618]
MLLQPLSHAIPTLSHDYAEWHQGRENYALWYIEITEPTLLKYLNRLREHFSAFLFQPNIRQFHITLFICGFLTQNNPVLNDDFPTLHLEQQIQEIIQQAFKSFKVSTGNIQSFDSALFVEVLDLKNSLSNIRTLLAKNHSEIAALQYLPHITLGLYNQAYSATQIFQTIENIPQKHFEINIEHLTFGYYKAKIIQGQLFAHQHIHLSSL